MMFFVSAKRLQAILVADRIEQLAKRQALAEQLRSVSGPMHITIGEYAKYGVQPIPTLTAIDQRVAAKKATTKAARPPRKPRDKK